MNYCFKIFSLFFKISFLYYFNTELIGQVLLEISCLILHWNILCSDVQKKINSINMLPYWIDSFLFSYMLFSVFRNPFVNKWNKYSGKIIYYISKYSQLRLTLWGIPTAADCLFEVEASAVHLPTSNKNFQLECRL